MMRIPDPRHIANGYEIPGEGYCDQPYVVKTDDGAWLCVMTTGKGVEGQRGQHIVTLRSMDCGRTWTDRVDVEPADGPEASYAVLLKTPAGRVYCFYNHNTDDIREIIADNPPYKDGRCRRVDSLGYFVFKYSDDHGRSWSPARYPVPVREMAIDRENPYAGKIRFFWNVGKPFMLDGSAYVSLHKVGGIGHGFFTRSEGVLLKSGNLLTESCPEKIAWETLPEGDHGLRAPEGGGPIAEEQSYSVMSDGSIYCVYRSIDGHPVCAYSRDGGRTWTPPTYKRFADGRLMKHPRAANFAWRCSNGRYLYWFHNHGGNWYEDRNPVWVCGGIETDSPDGKIIRWTQPEILLYDDDPYIRMSYPDLIEEDGRVYVTETQKHIARVHEIPLDLLDGLWSQFERAEAAIGGLVLDFPDKGNQMPPEAPMPELPAFLARDHNRPDYGTKDLRQGFTLDVWFRVSSLAMEQTILDTRTPDGQGVHLHLTQDRALKLILNDGRTESGWSCDPGLLEVEKNQHAVVIVDGGPKLILFLVNGMLCDGGTRRQFGWGRFSPNLRHANGGDTLRIGPTLRGDVLRLRIYGRALRVSEAIGNYRAGVGEF